LPKGVGAQYNAQRSTTAEQTCPLNPAREACYALREFIEKDDRWTQGRLRWDHVVVLPNAEIADDFALPECPRWKVIDRNNLPTLVDKLKHVLIQQELDRPLLTRQGIEQLSTALSGRGLPQRSVVARALTNQDAADALTEHQAVILDAIRLLNRVEIRGERVSHLGNKLRQWVRITHTGVKDGGPLRIVVESH
jgi:hypothetical protein